ncbi:hypothetical protein F2Q69_00044856 [Brassica cretica]|uniref:Uncharacterized protein n=1 Tax=Brassica cretica TaxID=69181 RepID=A0A8S9NA96_BRACR|nr:hypothetical protein F2Q69_00044856 [Brassica cretica]
MIVEAFVLRPKIAAAVETTADRRNAREDEDTVYTFDSAVETTTTTRCFLGFSLVYSDKETSLVVVKTHNNSNKPSESSDDGSSLVSISKRFDYLSDKSITCYVEELKAFRFVYHDYYSSAVQEKMKMITFSDELNTSFVLEKPFVVEDNKLETSLSEGCFIKEDMLVYEFMSCGVLKGLLAHERSFAINIQLIIGAANRFFWFQMLIANDLSVLCACLK